jgi:hypothetical protein
MGYYCVERENGLLLVVYCARFCSILICSVLEKSGGSFRLEFYYCFKAATETHSEASAVDQERKYFS